MDRLGLALLELVVYAGLPMCELWMPCTKGPADRPTGYSVGGINVSYMYVVIVMRSKAKERNRVLEIDELSRDLGSWLL